MASVTPRAASVAGCQSLVSGNSVEEHHKQKINHPIGILQSKTTIQPWNDDSKQHSVDDKT